MILNVFKSIGVMALASGILICLAPYPDVIVGIAFISAGSMLTGLEVSKGD